MNRLEKQRQAQQRRAQAEGPRAQSPRKIEAIHPEPVNSPRKFPLPPLPDGSEVHCHYVAEVGWRGKLSVGDVVFQAEARTVFTLLSRLDRFYRKSLEKP